MFSISNSPIGTLFRASQFLAEELPIRLAHRVQELDELPDGLNEMPSVNKVKEWYAQSFEVCSAAKVLS
jgi:pyruvate dehydrogenase kinase 2/3/4